MIYTYNTVPTQEPFVLWDNILLNADTYVYGTGSGSGPNVLTDTTNDYWIFDEVPSFVTAELPSSRWANTLGISSHNLGSNNCTIQVRAGASYDLVAEFTPEDDTTIILQFPRTQSQYWRVRVSEGDNPPSIGNIMLGERLYFESGITLGYTPMWMSEQIELLSNTSRNGHFLGNRVIKKTGSTSFDLNILDRDFVEGDNFQAFRDHYNDGNSFYFSSNAFELPKDVGYCRRSEGSVLSPRFGSSGIFYEMGLDLEVFLG